jgi:DNA-binding transcriptional MerR regulator
MSGNKYKIGEVSNMLGISIRTIRYYEEESLLKPIRTNGGTRLYSKNQIERLKAILHLSKNGFSIDAIRVIESTRDKCNTGDESSNKIKVILNTALADLEKQIQSLITLKKEINSTKKVIESCNGCSNFPSTKGCPHCLVPTKLSDVGLLNLIWSND